MKISSIVKILDIVNTLFNSSQDTNVKNNFSIEKTTTSQKNNEVNSAPKEGNVDVIKNTSTDNIVKEAVSQRQDSNNKEPDYYETKEKTQTNQSSLSTLQKAELGNKISKIIASTNSTNEWINLANVGSLLISNDISYKDYGFEKLSHFLNELTDYLDVRQVPSPKDGAPASLELRIKASSSQKNNEACFASEEGNAEAIKNTSTDNIAKEVKFQKQDSDNEEPDYCKINKKTQTSQSSLSTLQKAELGNKISKIIASTNSTNEWINLANVGSLLISNDISYKDYGFEKLSHFLNELTDYLDVRQAPSSKDGAPASLEFRIKATITSNTSNKNRNNTYSNNSSTTKSNNTIIKRNNSNFPWKRENTQKFITNTATYIKENIISAPIMESAASFLFEKTETSASDKLKEFAYFPSYVNGLSGSIKKLSQTVLEETWGFGDDKGHDYAILTSFFIYTFERLVYEDEINRNNPNWKTKIRTSNNGQYALFNTGLVDQYFEPVFALFKKTDREKYPTIVSKWVFKSFPNSKNDSMGIVYHLFGSDNVLPEPANYLEQNSNSELIYNLNFPISKSNNWEHIISDNCERLPLELLKSSKLPFDFTRFEDPSIDKKALHEELVNALKNSNESCRAIKFAIEKAISLALKRVRWNFKTAIPIYYPRTHKICLLLPLCLCNEKKVDAALVLDPVNGTYIQRTIFTLKMAYIDARLITRPDSDWLQTSQIDPTQEEI